MSDPAMLILHELLCILLLWTCFCRATRTNRSTRKPVLVSCYLLSISGLWAMFAPLIGWMPDSVSLLLLAAITLVQTVTARFWQQSPPAAFQQATQERAP